MLLHVMGYLIPLGRTVTTVTCPWQMCYFLLLSFLVLQTHVAWVRRKVFIVTNTINKITIDIYIYSSTSTKIKLFTTWKLEIKIIVRATLHPCLKSFLYKIYIQTLNHLQSTLDSSNVDKMILDSWHTFNYTCYL